MKSVLNLPSVPLLAHRVFPDDPWVIFVFLVAGVCVFVVVPLFGIRMIYKMLVGATRPAVSAGRSERRFRELSEHLQQMEIGIDQPSIEFGTAFDLLRQLIEDSSNDDEKEWLMQHVRQLRTAQSVLSQGEHSDCFQILAEVRGRL